MNVQHDARAGGGVVGRPAVCRADRPAEHGESIGRPAGRVVAFQGWRFPRRLRHTDSGALRILLYGSEAGTRAIADGQSTPG